tara:strand:+ start:3322 stop:3465 length:144 start_codon:yes stop_codon:yes gene_type:complete
MKRRKKNSPNVRLNNDTATPSMFTKLNSKAIIWMLKIYINLEESFYK